MRKRIRYRDRTPPELNITAFMNLMVALVPFLLITAVFSRITILQLHLPQGGGPAQEPAKTLQLEVVVRKQALVVQDQSTGVLTTLAKSGSDYDWKGLSDFLQRVKAKYPDKLDATILSEPDTEYETLVHVMDTVRMVQVAQNGKTVRAELFPEISIGDAPAERNNEKKL